MSLIEDQVPIENQGESEKGKNYVKRAIDFIRENYHDSIKVTDVADYVCINRSYLYTLFRKYLNMSPQQFLALYRITKAAELLKSTDFTVESIALSCGYSDALVFSKAFRLMKGMSPSRFRKDMMIREDRHDKEQIQEIEYFLIKSNGGVMED